MTEHKKTQVQEPVVLGQDPLANLFSPTPSETSLSLPANASTPVVTPTSLMPLPPIPESVLGEEGRQLVDAALVQLPVESLNLHQVIMLGSGAQRQLGAHLDALLGKVKKKEASKLFELFEQLATGVEGANLAELEEQMKKGQEPGWWDRAKERLGFSKVEDRLKQAAEDMRDLLSNKTETLLTLVQKMEKEAVDEVVRLVASLAQIDQMSKSYLASVEEFAISTQIACELRKKATERLEELTQRARDTNDPQEAARATEFRMLVQQLQNREMSLRIAYEKIPADLEILNMAKGAASSTLAETANGIHQEFNELKTALLQWHLLLSQQDMQNLNDWRRSMKEQIGQNNLQLLDRVATKAASLQGENRLEDAKSLREIGQGLIGIREKVQKIELDRQAQFREAESVLAEARTMFAALPAPASSQVVIEGTAEHVP